MAALATLQTRLEEAETALHQLMTGKQVARVGHGDAQVEYTKADLPALRSYIRDLNAQIAEAQGTRTRRPIGVKFGGLT